MTSKLVLLTFLDDSSAVDPGYGVGGRPPHGSTMPVYPPGHPSAGLPIAPVHPDAGLPSHGHISNRPPNVPPNVIWPPSNPSRPDNSLPSWQPSGNKPSQPIAPPTAGTKPVEPEQGLPAGSSLVLVYNAESGWQGAVVDQSGTTKPIAPPTAQPK